MSKDFNTNTDNKEDWLTPPWVIDGLGGADSFDLDPCAPAPDIRPKATARKHYHKAQDGLSLSWVGRVWLNPPYGNKTFTWMERLADHGNGIALIFCRTETKGFHAQIWHRADAVYFFPKRLKFYTLEGVEAKATANAPSCLVAYGENNAKDLEFFELLHGGKTVRLQKARP